MIKKILLSIGLMILANVAYSIETNDSIKCDKPLIDSISKIQYFIVVDSMPEYPGGADEMIKFFNTHIKYPEGIEDCCTVYVTFIIDSNGKMVDLRIVKSFQKKFDNEVLKVFRLMPDWKPGKCQGNPVNVKFTFPIRIELH